LKLEIGLNAAEQVIRRKTGAGTELSKYIPSDFSRKNIEQQLKHFGTLGETSIELAKYIIDFPETYEIENFQTLQQNALIALMTAVPETVCG
jgi:hypothetical protein